MLGVLKSEPFAVSGHAGLTNHCRTVESDCEGELAQSSAFAVSSLAANSAEMAGRPLNHTPRYVDESEVMLAGIPYDQAETVG